MGAVKVSPRRIPTGPRLLRSRPVRLRALAGIAIAGALVLAGCGNAPLDHAATIDGQRISETDLQEVTQEFNGLAPQPITPGEILTVLVQLPVLEDLAADAGSQITDGELVEQIRTIPQAPDEPSDLFLDLVRGLSYQQLAGGQLPQEQLDDLEVDINPRYGTWDPAQAAVVDEDPAWILPVDPEDEAGDDPQDDS